MLFGPICRFLFLNPFQGAKTSPLLFYCLTPDNFTHQGEPLGGKGLTGPICPSLFLNPFPPRLAKTSLFVILLCLMPDDFRGRGSGCEKVNNTTCCATFWVPAIAMIDPVVFHSTLDTVIPVSTNTGAKKKQQNKKYEKDLLAHLFVCFVYSPVLLFLFIYLVKLKA